MSDVTRRHALVATTAAAAAAAGLTSPTPAEAAPEHAAAAAPKTPKYSFRLADAPLERYTGGTLRRATSDTFPASPLMSGGIMHVDPGGMREPHWHPNAVEWDYVIAGRFRFNVLDPDGRSETFEVSAGDLVVIPQGFGHYFENVGDEVATLLLTFNVGKFDEIGISEWVAKTPKASFTVPLGLDENALANAPDHKLFLASRKAPGK